MKYVIFIFYLFIKYTRDINAVHIIAEVFGLKYHLMPVSAVRFQVAVGFVNVKHRLVYFD